MQIHLQQADSLDSAQSASPYRVIMKGQIDQLESSGIVIPSMASAPSWLVAHYFIPDAVLGGLIMCWVGSS